MSEPDERVCTKCGQTKPLDEFSKAPRGKYGRKASCKVCDAKRHTSQYVPKPGGPRRAPFRGDEEKRCGKCGVVKTLADFNLSRKATSTSNAVYRSDCKECCAAYARKWFAEHPERANENKRRANLRKLYGLTVADYNAMLQSQGGVCAICGNGEPAEHGRTGKQFRLAVDHCHNTNTNRGLLCQRCNRAMGLFGDDPALLRKAISYLHRHRVGVSHQQGE